MFPQNNVFLTPRGVRTSQSVIRCVGLKQKHLNNKKQPHTEIDAPKNNDDLLSINTMFLMIRFTLILSYCGNMLV